MRIEGLAGRWDGPKIMARRYRGGGPGRPGRMVLRLIAACTGLH
jgi:hypothetical protein